MGGAPGLSNGFIRIRNQGPILRDKRSYFRYLLERVMTDSMGTT